MVKKARSTSSTAGNPTAEADVRDKFWQTAKKAVRHVPFMEDVVAAYYCALDRQTPMRAKMVMLGALGYFVMPVDAIPDFIIGMGFTDDVAVLAAAIAAIKANLTPAHRTAAKEALTKL